MTRWIAEGTWVASSALHCGEPATNDLAARDMVLIRNTAGEFFIPAASLTGAARNYVGRRLMPPAQFESSDEDDRKKFAEPAAIRFLFGSRMEYASALVVDDGFLESKARAAVRDGVRISSTSGLAHEDSDGGAKYDAEIVPAGARFRLRFEFRPAAQYNQAERVESLSVFALMLTGFSQGEIRLGARTNRGYGAGTVDHWTIRRVETPAEYISWLKRETNAGTEVSLDTLHPNHDDHRQHLEIVLWLRLETSLLVRSGGGTHGDPDALHLTENGRSILPGTSLAGVLRHRCERIANTFQAEGLVEAMFGPLKNAENREALRASRLRVDEATMHDTEAAVHTRVAIDRFTQAALESKLFEEAPLFPRSTQEGHIRGLRIRLMAPRSNEQTTSFPREAGLLLVAIKDLWLGDLTVGGGAGVGRGVMRGIKATFRASGWNDQLTILRKSETGPEIQVEGSEDLRCLLDNWCRNWRSAQ